MLNKLCVIEFLQFCYRNTRNVKDAATGAIWNRSRRSHREVVLQDKYTSVVYNKAECKTPQQPRTLLQIFYVAYSRTQTIFVHYLKNCKIFHPRLHNSTCLSFTHVSVSYTHLDVYKRQMRMTTTPSVVIC